MNRTRTTAPARQADSPVVLRDLLARFQHIRQFSRTLCEPLEIEDYVIQSMTDASPVKWHLAHTTWFFERFILAEYADDHQSFDDDFNYLFNSYYVQMGARHARPKRGLLSRPTVARVLEYRAAVEEQLAEFLDRADAATLRAVAPLVEIGLNHEQQHQELLLTDLKHLLAQNPLHPVYRKRADHGRRVTRAAPIAWLPVEAGVHEIGHTGDGFAYDNELPRHRVFLEDVTLASRLITNGEYLAFMRDDGYARQDLWLDEGWAVREREGWTAPLYWQEGSDGWQQFTLQGLRDVDPFEPVTHISFYEADAYARWADARLATEAEWEVLAANRPIEGNFVEDGWLHPRAVADGGDEPTPRQLFGDAWEWTGSAYRPYPGFSPPAGALGEYNGKFMNNQYVLRGGSCATSRDHVRVTYRNFFAPTARWQFTGIRLARDSAHAHAPEIPS